MSARIFKKLTQLNCYRDSLSDQATDGISFAFALSGYLHSKSANRYKRLNSKNKHAKDTIVQCTLLFVKLHTHAIFINLCQLLYFLILCQQQLIIRKNIKRPFFFFICNRQ